MMEVRGHFKGKAFTLWEGRLIFIPVSGKIDERKPPRCIHGKATKVKADDPMFKTNPRGICRACEFERRFV